MTPSCGHVSASSRLSHRALLAVGGAAAVARVAPVRAGPRHGFADVQSWIERQVDAGRIVGAAVSIARDGVILWESGFGFADIASRARATPITPFGLASITKPFVTAALAASASAGRIDLDGPVEQALPFRLPVSAFSADGVSARRLGSHCSGLPSFFRLAVVPGRPPVMEALIEEFGRIAYPPGAVYEYSNLGFALLGEALSHIEGASFEAAMHRRIIRPMGLRDSFFLSERSGRNRPATRYDAERRPIPDYTTATPASGELCGSAHDLSIFVRLDGLSGCGRAGLHEERWRSGRLDTSHLTPRTPGIDIAQAADRIASLFVDRWQGRSEDIPSKIADPRGSAWFEGEWTGTLSNGGRIRPIELTIGRERSHFRIGTGAPVELEECRTTDGFLTARCRSRIDRSTDADLRFRLMPHADQLIGRILQRAPNSTLPYIVSVGRV